MTETVKFKHRTVTNSRKIGKIPAGQEKYHMLVALVIFLIVRSKHVFSGQQLTCIDEQEK